MRAICLDQGSLRSEALASAIQNSDCLFVLPDAAVMEMSKSASWERILRLNLALLARVPSRTLYALGNGECLDTEISKQAPVVLDDLISDEHTDRLRGLLAKVADGRRGDYFELHAREIEAADARMRAGHLNHGANLEQLKTVIPAVRRAFSEDDLRRLRNRSVSDKEYRQKISEVTLNAFPDLESTRLSLPVLKQLAESKSFIFRHLWLRVRDAADWLARGGVEQIRAEKVTNSDVDRHYVNIGSYCAQLLSKDQNVQRLDADLRHVLQATD